MFHRIIIRLYNADITQKLYTSHKQVLVILCTTNQGNSDLYASDTQDSYSSVCSVSDSSSLTLESHFKLSK